MKWTVPSAQLLDQQRAGLTCGLCSQVDGIVGDRAGLDHIFRRQEDAGAQMLARRCSRMISSANELSSISRAEVHALDARQVVEPVAVLQGLQLGFEDEVEGRAEQAAEQVLLLGQAADPQVDRVEAGDRAGAPLRRAPRSGRCVTSLAYAPRLCMKS